MNTGKTYDKRKRHILCPICEYFEYEKIRDRDWALIDREWKIYTEGKGWALLRKSWGLPIVENNLANTGILP